ncbi:MAG: hypothetical protein LBS36_06305 [Oscillospiraceae bacterium]|nr:hypothetical protein [Oscillospiraceae bacterium]
MRLGLYSSCGDLTCEDLPGSCGHEETDAGTFARWGVSYLKYDYCHVVDMQTDANGGKQFPSQTPPFLYIGITPLDEPGKEAGYAAETAEVSGGVRVEDGALRGLSCNAGWALFRVNAPSAGTYSLAVCYQKSFSERRQFALAAVNDADDYELWFPRSSGWSETGRVHVNIKLNQGENTIRFYNPVTGQKEDSYLRYRRMERGSLPPPGVWGTTSATPGIRFWPAMKQQTACGSFSAPARTTTLTCSKWA